MVCRNCDKEGHKASECTEERNVAKVQCRNCDNYGHYSKNCPEPRNSKSRGNAVLGTTSIPLT